MIEVAQADKNNNESAIENIHNLILEKLPLDVESWKFLATLYHVSEKYECSLIIILTTITKEASLFILFGRVGFNLPREF